MSTLEDYRNVARSIGGWFTWEDLFRATKHLGMDPGRTSNAIVTLRSRGELEWFEKTDRRKRGQLYRIKSAPSMEGSADD